MAVVEQAVVERRSLELEVPGLGLELASWLVVPLLAQELALVLEVVARTLVVAVAERILVGEALLDGLGCSRPGQACRV